jgi:DNA-directed RNA polymerase specialized sigma24 family protein
MEAPPWKSSDEGSEAYSEPSVRASYRLILQACLSAGLSPADADDIAQDLWEWLIRNSVPIAVIASPWLKAAVHNYILRFKRRSYWHRAREGRALESIPEPQCSQFLPALESSTLLDRTSARLPERERNLLALVREGHTIAEAARKLGIPRGSCAYYQGRIVDYARREIQGRAPATRETTAHTSGTDAASQGHARGKAAFR